MKAIISIVAFAMTFASVLAQELRGGPAVLSDVAMTNAGSEGREWHPKTKYVSDILKEKSETKLIGGGRKWDHKTKLITDILKESNSDKTKLISDGYKQYLKNIDDIHDVDFVNEHMCEKPFTNLYNCLGDEVTRNCAGCIVGVLEQALGMQMVCTDMAEVGFCAAMIDCWNNECNADCESEMILFVGCSLHDMGCDDYEIHDECTTPKL